MAAASGSFGTVGFVQERGSCDGCGLPVWTAMRDALPLCPNCGHRPCGGD